MTKAKGFLFGVLVFTLFSFTAHAQDAAWPQESKIDVKEPTFAVYPNPIKDIAKFKFDQMNDPKWIILDLQVFNLVGDSVLSAKHDDFSCERNQPNPCVLTYESDFRSQQTGMYLVMIDASNGTSKFKRTYRVVYAQ